MDLFINEESPYIDVRVESFEKTKLEQELDKIFGYKPRSIFEDVVSTYHKYISLLGRSRVRVICNEVEPMIYKIGPEEICIINK